MKKPKDAYTINDCEDWLLSHDGVRVAHSRNGSCVPRYMYPLEITVDSPAYMVGYGPLGGIATDEHWQQAVEGVAAHLNVPVPWARGEWSKPIYTMSYGDCQKTLAALDCAVTVAIDPNAGNRNQRYVYATRHNTDCSMLEHPRRHYVNEIDALRCGLRKAAELVDSLHPDAQRVWIGDLPAPVEPKFEPPCLAPVGRVTGKVDGVTDAFEIDHVTITARDPDCVCTDVGHHCCIGGWTKPVHHEMTDDERSRIAALPVFDAERKRCSYRDMGTLRALARRTKRFDEVDGRIWLGPLPRPDYPATADTVDPTFG